MSPFKSKKQMKYLFMNEPEVAKRWRKENPRQNLKKLPEKVTPKKRK